MVLPDVCGELLARRALDPSPNGAVKPDAGLAARACLEPPLEQPARLFFKSCRGRSARGGAAATHENGAPAKTLDRATYTPVPDHVADELTRMQDVLTWWIATAVTLAIFFVILLVTGGTT
jgi:hypothetical protein